MGKGIVKRLAAVLSLIGPGIFAIGYTIGTGSVTSMAKAGADYGLGLLWVLALSCLFSGVLMTAYGRFAAVTGETTLHGIVRFLPGGKWIAAMLFLGVVTAQYTCLGGILLLTSGAIREAFGLPVGIFPIVCAIMAMMLAFAMVGRYAFFEKVLSFFVALMALAFAFSLAVAFVGGRAFFERFIREPPSAGNVAQSQPAYVDVPPVAISNGVLSATISPFGAELRSVRMDGIEYLWQQEPDRPSGMAPVLFPICGSLNQGRYTFGGREYALPVHGFAKRSLFRTECAPDGASATFTLESDDATRAVYPFDFALAITFRLDGRTLSVEASVTNRCDAEMPFAYGGHPGFNVPLGGEGAFEDCFLEFGPEASPKAFEFAEGGLLAGAKRAFPLEPGGRLPLRHGLFNTYGLFLSGTGGSVTLRSGKSPRSVTVRFPDMPDVGFWHAPGEAPFLCIEPWTGMPSVAGVPDDLAVRPDMVRLAPGAAATLRYFVEFR